MSSFDQPVSGGVHIRWPVPPPTAPERRDTPGADAAPGVTHRD